jgi:regulator of protease activity HflC (stomatin/prohibitin superfamily)
MEKEIHLRNNGFFQLFVAVILLAAPVCNIFIREMWVIPVSVVLSVTGVIWMTGLFIVQPNQTKVLVFFGKYCGTVKSNGFFWLNPFYVK